MSVEPIDDFRESPDEDLSAIREALDDVRKGHRGIQFEQFEVEFCSHHDIPASAMRGTPRKNRKL
jgi:hypothetical protein